MSLVFLNQFILKHDPCWRFGHDKNSVFFNIFHVFCVYLNMGKNRSNMDTSIEEKRWKELVFFWSSKEIVKIQFFHVFRCFPVTSFCFRVFDFVFRASLLIKSLRPYLPFCGWHDCNAVEIFKIWFRRNIFKYVWCFYELIYMAEYAEYCHKPIYEQIEQQ